MRWERNCADTVHRHTEKHKAMVLNMLAVRHGIIPSIRKNNTATITDTMTDTAKVMLSAICICFKKDGPMAPANRAACAMPLVTAGQLRDRPKASSDSSFPQPVPLHADGGPCVVRQLR